MIVCSRQQYEAIRRALGPAVTLDEIYAAVPPMACRGLCVDSCDSQGVEEVETIRIELRHGVRVETHTGRCPALSPFGRCSVYADRPLVCRLWGAVPEMRCPHGCEPTLTSEQGLDLMRQLRGL